MICHNLSEVHSSDTRILPLAILLATHNGETYLAEQLDSLQAQSCQDFSLFVLDDGSSDGTLAILQEYLPRFGDRMRILPDDGIRRGACGSFGRLLGTALAAEPGFDYFAFCDQDDCWEPTRLEETLKAVQAGEGSSTIPCLAHCDLRVVDASGVELQPSFWRHRGIRPDCADVQELAFGNTVTGNTCLINRRLAELADPIPDTAVMHDWWLALVAAALGRILVVDQALVRYRQHDGNFMGARQAGLARFFSARHWRERALNLSNSFYPLQMSQVQILVERYSGQSSRLQALSGLRDFSNRSWLGKRWRLLKSGFYPRSWIGFLDLMVKL